jgi:MoxR-like ATPase
VTNAFLEAALTYLTSARDAVQLSDEGVLIALDEEQLKTALDAATEFIKVAQGILTPVQEDGQTDISPVPLKKAKRDSITAPQAPAISTSEARNSTVLSAFSEYCKSAEGLWHRSKALFEWQDGPLVAAMKEGDMFVLDEINLAEDAVIERLNSVLESGREITLAEKGGLTVSSEKIVAHPNFKFLATMNPGGDFGKRELSPALRSRFTEMWVPSANSGNDVALIVAEILHLDELCGLSSEELAGAMVRFMTWLNTQSSTLTMKGVQISVREVLAWAKFVSAWSPHTMSQAYAGLLHGAHMVLLDGLGIGLSIPREIVRELKRKAVQQLLNECQDGVRDDVYMSVYPQDDPQHTALGSSNAVVTVDQRFTLGGVGFSIPMGPSYDPTVGMTAQSSYILTARSVMENMRRILRAMQLPRPILLEGPPGVGKTSLISNLAKLTGHNLVRINLSEHSEISDLLGSDLPAPLDYDQTAEEEENGSASKRGKSTSSGPKFVWCDGVFLTALKRGDWVLLDELNLAPQSVLEGLNACLDHRGEVFLPEIGQSFFCPPSFRVFCAQNPAGEGGGRKGLPQSFLTRFSRVFVEEMDERDVREIAMQAYTPVNVDNTSSSSSSSSGSSGGSGGDDSSEAPEGDMMVVSDENILEQIKKNAPKIASSSSLLLRYLPQMVRFTRRLQSDIVDLRLYGNAGSPWEFNLRDIFRWCELVQCNSKACSVLGAGSSSSSVFVPTAEARYILADAANMLFFSRLRTRADREGASKAFADVFGWSPLPDHNPSVQRVGNNVLIGLALLPKSFLSNTSSTVAGVGYNGEEGPEGYQSNPLMLAGLSKVMETMAHCVSLRWPALLIGPSGSGKRRCLRQLALATGRSLVEFPATASTDSTELLGSFEQASAYRHLRFGLEYLELAAAPLFSLLTDKLRDTDAATVANVEKTLALLSQTQCDAETVISSASLRLKSGEDLFSSLLCTLRAVSESMSSFCEEPSLKNIARNVRMNDVMSNLAESRTFFDKCYFDCSFVPSGSAGGGQVSGFEWVDGVVVQALKKGHWLLIDNVNLCSASVLDRLNSLLEPGGTLLLTESGVGTILTPHPDFRIFFSMDPSHGEISRAMRNRCVEVSLIVEGDAEVAVAFLLSQVSTTSAPLLSAHTDSSDMQAEALLSPLCSTYEALAIAEVDDTDDSQTGGPWDLTGSLISSGVPASTFPRFRMFARLLRLVAIETQAGLAPRDALQCGLQSVLPFFSLAHSNCSEDESEIMQRVVNMQVDEENVSYQSISSSKSPLEIVLTSPFMQHLPSDMRASIVLLILLSSSSSVMTEQTSWLRVAARSVRHRATRDLFAFTPEVNAAGAVVKKTTATSSVSARERMNLDIDGAGAATALHILAEMESDISNSSPDAMSYLSAFILSSLIRSAVSQPARVHVAVQHLLTAAGETAMTETFLHWMGFSSGSAQMELMNSAMARDIVGVDFDDDEGATGDHGRLCALRLLQRGCESTAAALGTAVSAASLGARSSFKTSTAAVAYGATCSHLLDVAIFGRWLALNGERMQREEVDGAITLSATSSLPSLFALAYALYKRRIVADTSELQVLLSVHAALLVADVVLAKITEEVSSSSPRNGESKYCEVMSVRTMECLQVLLDRRDMLSKVLCEGAAPSTGSAKVRIPWEDIIVCVRWIKKAVSALMISLKSTGDSPEGGEAGNEQGFLAICVSAHTELNKFDRALGDYWNRPVLLDSASNASASSKLRLWKEGGHAAVPYRLADWSTLRTLKDIVQPIKRTLPSFVDAQLETMQVADAVTAQCTPSKRKEWLCLYSTFYWMRTNESASITNGAATVTRSAITSVDVETLAVALKGQFYGDISLEVVAQDPVYADNDDGDVYGEADYPLLADKAAAQKVRREWEQAGELSVSILIEPTVIASLFSVSDALQSFLRHSSIRVLSATMHGCPSVCLTGDTASQSVIRLNKAALVNLSSQLSSMICLALRYTLFDLEDFREMQTFLWSIEAVLAVMAEASAPPVALKKRLNGKVVEKVKEVDRELELREAEDTVLALARVFSIQFEVRLQSLLSRNLMSSMDAVPFSYSSPTLKAILEPSLAEAQGGLETLVSTSIQIPWSWTLSTGMTAILCMLTYPHTSAMHYV